MPESVPLPLKGQLENARQLERQVDQIAKRASKNLKIDFTGGSKNIDSLSQPLGRITGKADEFTKSMEAANARVIAFGASVGILSAVTQSFKALVTTTIEVEKSLAKINSILNTNATGLEKLKGQIFDIAKNTEQTFDTVSEAALELSRQGLSATEVTKRLNDSLILSRLSGVDAAEAVGSLTAAVNGFSKSGLTTSEILNKVSAAANKFAVSERDLFEGFKRSASVAQQAGVSLDELGGIITAVQQKTARGGAVIGNSLKTIFTRIGKEESVSLLRELGVEITNVEGNLLPATQVIENLAKSFDTLSESQQRQVAFKIGGGFQIAPLLAALQDYSEENSIAIKATEAFSNATNEAYNKNIALNKTLAAGIQSTSLSVQELANTLGELGVTDVFGTLLTSIGGVVEKVTSVLQGDGLGSTFARGLVKGVSSLILPALGLVIVIIGKLSKDLLKFGVDSLKTFLGLSNAAERLKSVEERTYNILLNNEGVRKQILAIENASISAEQKKVLQSELFTKSLLAQKNVLLELQQISSRVAPGVIAGVSGGRSSKISRSAGGFLPVGAEQRDINSGVGGAPKGSKPVVIPNFAFGGGKRGTMVANSSEYIVPNFAGGGSAIFNQDMVKSIGLPSGAKKINAAGGFIPNFAAKQVLNNNSKYVMLTGEKNKSNPNKIAYRQPDGKFNQTKTKNAQPIKVPVYGLTSKTKSKDIDEFSERLETYAYRTALAQARSLSGGQMPDPVKRSAIKSSINKGSVGSFAGSIYELSLAALLTDEEFLKYSAATDTASFDLGLKGQSKLKELYNIGGDPFFGEVKGRGNADNVASTAAKIYRVEGLKGTAQKSKLVDKTIPKDDAVRLGLLKDSDPNRPYKIQESDLGKIGVENFNKFKKQRGSSGRLTFQGASGYIPNYANGGALEEAIQREKDAGVPINQIRINQDGKLRNSQNPNGIAVTNTRDEPTGAIPKNAARGYIHNFAAGGKNKVGDAAEASSAKLFALSTVAFALQGALGGVASETDGFGKRIAESTQGLSQLVTTLLLFQGLGVNVSGGLVGGSKNKIDLSQATIRKNKAGKNVFGAGSIVGGKNVGGQFISKEIGGFQVATKKASQGFKAFTGGFLKFLPVIGQGILIFQGLNSILKLFGVDLVGGIGKALGLIDTPAQKAAKALDKLNKSALDSIARQGLQGNELKDFVKNLNDVLPQTKKLGQGRQGSVKEGDQKFTEALLTEAGIGAALDVNREGLLKGVGTKKGTFRSSDFVSLDESQQEAFIRDTIQGKSKKDIEKGIGIRGVLGLGPGEQGLQGEIDPKQQAAQTRLILGFASLARKELTDGVNEGIASADPEILQDKLKKAVSFDGLGEENFKLFKDLSNSLRENGDLTLEQRKEVQKLLAASDKVKKKEEARVSINADIAKIQSDSAFNTKLAIAGSESELETRLKIKNTLKETTDLEKFGNTTTLNRLESERKFRVQAAKETKKLLDAQGAVKSVLTPNDRQELDSTELKKYNDALGSISNKILNNGKISKEEIKDILIKTGLVEKESDLLDTIAGKAFAQLSATKQIATVELGILETTRAKAKLEELSAQNRERQLKSAERLLTADTRRINRNKESQDLADQIKIAGIRSQGIGGDSRAGASVQRQIAEVERAAKIREAGQSDIKAREKLQTDFISILREAGAKITKADIQGFRDAGSTNGDFVQFQSILERTAEEQKQIQINALELQKSEINTALINGSSAQINATAAKMNLEAAQLNSGNAIVDAINTVTGSVEGSDTEAGKEALKERLKALDEQIKKVNELDFSLFLGKGEDAVLDLAKTVEVNGQKIILANLQFGNALAESGASLKTFANLVRDEFNSIADQKAQDAFTLATSADPSAIEGALANKSRISTLETASGTGAEKIAQANELAIFQEKELALIGAKDAATRVSLEFEYEKKLEIIDLARQANELDSKEPGYAQKVLEIRTKIAEVRAKEQTLSQKLTSNALSAEDSKRSLEDTFVGAAKTFTDTLGSGLNDAIVKGGELGDVLRSAAFDFFNTIANQAWQNVFQQIGFGTSDSGGGGIFGGIGKILGLNQGGIVNGGSGSKDDVPAMLMGGEYVMKKSAVNKYGAGFMESINAGKAPAELQKFANGGLVRKEDELGTQTGEGGFFIPGTYGGSIQGKQNLLDFATQSFTSGARDVRVSGAAASGGGGYSGVSLEAESVRLTNRGRKLGTPLQQATLSAKEQAFGLRTEQLNLEEQLKEQEKARKKAFKNQLISAGIGIVAGGLVSGFKLGAKNAGGLTGGFKDGIGAGLKQFGKGVFGGLKGSIFGGEIKGAQGTFGGLKNIFSARGGITNDKQLFEYIQKNPDSSLARNTDLFGTAPSRAFTVDSGPQTLAQAQRSSGFNYAGGSAGGLPQRGYDALYRKLGNGLLPPRRATGGYVSETAGVDTVPTMLSGGEFVMNSAAADRVGRGNLEKMNSGVSEDGESKGIANEELLSKLDDLIEATKESTGEINITVNGEGGREEESGGQGGGNREFAKKLKEQVVNIIEEEKRLGGSLRNDKL